MAFPCLKLLEGIISVPLCKVSKGRVAIQRVLGWGVAAASQESVEIFYNSCDSNYSSDHTGISGDIWRYLRYLVISGDIWNYYRYYSKYQVTQFHGDITGKILVVYHTTRRLAGWDSDTKIFRSVHDSVTNKARQPPTTVMQKLVIYLIAKVQHLSNGRSS